MPNENELNFERCSKDDCNQPVSNKRHQLCHRHNWERRKGKDYYEHLKEKQKKYEQKQRAKRKPIRRKPNKKVSRISDKQKAEKSLLAKVYEQIKEERDHYCRGCGSGSALSFSHLVPRSRRKDLVCEPRNIELQCLTRQDGSKGCHKRWEDGDFLDLENYKDLLERVKELDEEYYRLLMLKKNK